MDFQLHPKRAPAKIKRSANAHKMDLDFLCNGLTKIDLNKPTDLTHNKIEKAIPTSEISNFVAHTKTRISGAGDGSIQKSSKKPKKVGWNNSMSQTPKGFKVKPRRYSVDICEKRKRKSRAKALVKSYRTNGGIKGNERDPSRVSEIFTYDPKKGYRYVCQVCKRMYTYEVNLLNHTIVDHHSSNAYLLLPESRKSSESSRRATERELISCASWPADDNLGNPDQWINCTLTILNVQWARYLFDDERTLKICMDSGMSFGDVKDRMERLDELDRWDKEEFDSAKASEEKEMYMRKGFGREDMKCIAKSLSKREFSLWKAAVEENELVEGMKKMMRGVGGHMRF